jgi:hypothetical protein
MAPLPPEVIPAGTPIEIVTDEDGTVPVYGPNREVIGRARLVDASFGLLPFTIEIEIDEKTRFSKFYQRQVAGVFVDDLSIHFEKKVEHVRRNS